MLDKIFSIFNSKYFPWVLLIIVFLGALGAISKTNDQLSEYKRQLRGQLSEKERILQKANSKLNILNAKLVTQKDLVKRWKMLKEERDEEFQDFVKEHDLKIKSMDRTIAELRQQLKGGSTEVIVKTGTDRCQSVSDNCVISYSWEDTLKRFKLKDPNIFKKGNEIFESEQIFKIYGEVYEQKDGSLQIRRLVLREVVPDKDGKYKPVPNGKANIVDSDFNYSNPPTIDAERSWTDIFTLRPIVLGSLTMLPENKSTFGVGVEFIKLDRFGLNTHTAILFDDIKNTEQRIGLTYNPKLFNKDLNLSLGLSAGTPIINLGNKVSFNIDLLFYLW